MMCFILQLAKDATAEWGQKHLGRLLMQFMIKNYFKFAFSYNAFCNYEIILSSADC